MFACATKVWSIFSRGVKFRTDFINQAIKLRRRKEIFCYFVWKVDLHKVLSKNYQVFLPAIKTQFYAWVDTHSSLHFSQSVGQFYWVNCGVWLARQLTFILSEIEDVLDLLVRRVFSSRKLLSSKLEPKPESEQEIQRDLLLKLSLVIILSDVQHKHD